jgi:SAM-dependent methyltransferase
MNHTCPLCSNATLEPVAGPDARTYLFCPLCSLISVDPACRVDLKEAMERYRADDNGIVFPGYFNFLGQVVRPLLPYLQPGQRGLDYGCGSVPALSGFLRTLGYKCDEYDPLFFPIELNPPYDFIFATECLEHFFHPAKDLERITQMLNPGGYLAIMTLLWKKKDELSSWEYADNPTHVSFYHADTFAYISQHFGLEMIWSDGERCMLFHKKSENEGKS